MIGYKDLSTGVVNYIRSRITLRNENTPTFFANARSFDEIIHNDSVYMRRWYLWRNELSTARIHDILRPDDDRHLHDHPFDWAFSLILEGGYTEERLKTPGDVGTYTTHYRAGDMNLIKRGEYHRISSVLPDTRTLFITGKPTKGWGFLVDGVHVDRHEYHNPEVHRVTEM